MHGVSYLRFFLEDIYIICSYTRGYQIKQQKISEKDILYFQPEDNHETSQKRKSFKKLQFQTWV